MKSRWIVLLSVSMLGFACVRAGERGMRPGAGGPLQQVLEHSKELGLSEEQKTKIEALIKENAPARENAMRERMKDNPELAKEMREARGDPEKMKAVREKMREKMEKDGPGEAKRGEGVAKIADILSREQMQKLREIREKQGGEGGPGPRRGGREGQRGGSSNEGNKPDPSKGVPDPFDK